MARLTTVNDIGVRFTQAPGAENVILLSFQAVNAANEPVSGRFPLHVYFTSSASTLIESAATYSGAVTATVGTLVHANTAKKNFDAVTNADGLLTISITATAEPADFAVVQGFGLDPRLFVSPVFAAWGEAE